MGNQTRWLFTTAAGHPPSDTPPTHGDWVGTQALRERARRAGRPRPVALCTVTAAVDNNPINVRQQQRQHREHRPSGGRLARSGGQRQQRERTREDALLLSSSSSAAAARTASSSSPPPPPSGIHFIDCFDEQLSSSNLVLSRRATEARRNGSVGCYPAALAWVPSPRAEGAMVQLTVRVASSTHTGNSLSIGVGTADLRNKYGNGFGREAGTFIVRVCYVCACL